jgi:hypothetical protein
MSAIRVINGVYRNKPVRKSLSILCQAFKLAPKVIL